MSKMVFTKKINLFSKCMLLILLSSIIVMSFSSCSVTNYDGLDYYASHYKSIGDFELTLDLIYNDSLFLEEYDYTSGDFHFEKQFLVYEKVILYLEYDSSTYSSAKNAVLENTILDKSRTYSFSGYVFYENMDLPISHGHVEDGHNTMPFKWFNLVGYNDETHTIIFLGAQLSPENSNTPEKYDITNEEEMVDFIIREYSHWYSFQ